MNKEAVDFSINWWKGRHEAPDAYFPKMEQHWNWRLYEEMPGWFLKMAKPQPGDVVLEIGCGYGQWMAPLSKLVQWVDGFDIHPSLAVKFVEQMAAFRNTNMMVGNGTVIPFPGPYSLVYSISVFQHMPRAIVYEYFKEIKRVLTPDGRALLHFRYADNDGPYADDIVIDHAGDWSVGWTKEEADAVCQETGLKITEHEAGGHSLIILVKAT